MDCCGGGMPAVAGSLDWWLLLGTGLTISLGHCLGMCGPLVTAFSLTQRRDGTGGWRLLPRLLVYHTGRLGGYALLGAAFGLVGAAADLGRSRSLQGGFSLLVGVMMLLLALGLLGWLPSRRWVESGPLQRLVADRLGRWLQGGGWGRRLLFGLGNGLLPCGPVYAVALRAAAARHPLTGAGAMAAFGLGTVPVLLILGFGAGSLPSRWRSFFNRLGAVLVLIMAVQLILRGGAALGWVGHFRWGDVVFW